MRQVEITKPFERWHFRVEYYDIGHIQSAEEASNIDNALMKRIENFFKEDSPDQQGEQTGGKGDAE